MVYPSLLIEKDELGDYAFSPQRNRLKVKFEQNTPTEKELLDKIRKFVVNNKPFDSQTVTFIKKLLKNDKYNDIFMEPSDQKLLRGMMLPEESLRKILKLKKSEAIPNKGLTSDLSGFRFKSKNIISSWTKDRIRAHKFSIDSPFFNFKPYIGKEKIYSIILVTTPGVNSDYSFFDFQNIYDLKGVTEFDYEREVLCLNKYVTIKELQWSEHPYLNRRLNRQLETH